MAEGEVRFLDIPSQTQTAELIGHVTQSVIAILPAASVEWSRWRTGLTVRVTLGERQASFAFGALVDLRGSIANHAKAKARDLCREVLGHG